jgi:hypothetical protein
MIFSLLTVCRLISRECVIAGLILPAVGFAAKTSITAGLIPTPLRRMSDSQTS